MGIFSLDELKSEPAASVAGSGIHKSRFLDAHLVKVESIKNLVGVPPNEGEVYFLWTVKSFNAFTFIPYFIKEHGVIEDLIITTYSMSTRILSSLVHYIEKGKILNTHVMISESVKFRLPRVQEQLEHLTRVFKDQFTVHYSWNHSKICLIKTKEGYYLVEGSGNFSENAQHEQYILLNSKTIFEFRKQEIYGIQQGKSIGD